MRTVDLRREGEVRPRPFSIDGRTIDPSMIASVERLFDRDHFVSDYEALFDDKRLQGQEVLTIPNQMAPISKVRYHMRPSARSALRRQLQAGNTAPDIRPRPHVDLVATVGWPGVQVAPTGDYSVSIEWISNPQGGEASAETIDDLREAIANHTLFLSVDGSRYPIDEMTGSALVLEIPVEFLAPQTGTIHNGANRFQLVAERVEAPDGDRASGRRGKDESRDPLGAPTPILSASTLPGNHDVTITARGEERSVHVHDTVTVNVDRPPAPSITDIGYRYGDPIEPPANRAHLNKSLSALYAEAKIPHGTNTAILVGARYRVASRVEGEWKYGERQYTPFGAKILRWQLKAPDDVQSKSRQTRILLGDFASTHPRRVDIAFIDEVGRRVGQQVIRQEPGSPKKGGYITNHGLADRFGVLARRSTAAPSIDIESYYDKADAKIENLKAEAESVVEGRAVQEIPTEKLKPPSAALNLSSNGLEITADASKSTHPNNLKLTYRFDWTGDGSYETPRLESPMRTHTYDSSGTYTVTVEVEGEEGYTDVVSETISVS